MSFLIQPKDLLYGGLCTHYLNEQSQNVFGLYQSSHYERLHNLSVCCTSNANWRNFEFKMRQDWLLIKGLLQIVLFFTVWQTLSPSTKKIITLASGLSLWLTLKFFGHFLNNKCPWISGLKNCCKIWMSEHLRAMSNGAKKHDYRTPEKWETINLEKWEHLPFNFGVFLLKLKSLKYKSLIWQFYTKFIS